VLPAASRLRRRPDFSAAMRQGRRVSRPRLVVHLALAETGGMAVRPSAIAAQDNPGLPVRAGFVVPRAVGGAVVRNRVRRQLRQLVADRIDTLPAGARLVVRVLPAAAGSTTAQLAGDLDTALARCLHTAVKAEARGPSA
jgi:ribonuclease P protein component